MTRRTNQSSVFLVARAPRPCLLFSPLSRAGHPCHEYICKVLLAAGVLIGAAGCSDPKSDSGSMTNRQDDALQDPFNYGPKLPTTQPQKHDDSLKGQWDRFWNP